MWSSSLPIKSSRETNSPAQDETWKADEDGNVVCADIFEDSSPGTVSVRQEYFSPHFLTPVSAHGRNYLIIPLHSPQRGSLDNHILMETTQRAMSHSSDIGSFYSVSLKSENSSHAYRRSPEKRFCSPGPICRICHEDDHDESLISPCNCSGSLALVHKTCIEKWLTASNIDECEICKLRLPLRRQTRPIWQWFGMTGTAHGPQGFYADIMCILLLTPLCLISVYLCALGASEYMKHGVWEGTGLALLSFFLLTTYLLWFYVTVRYHWNTVKQWRNANQVIHLDVKYLKRQNKNIQISTHNNDASPISSRVLSPANVPQTLGTNDEVNRFQHRSPRFVNNNERLLPLNDFVGGDMNPVYV